MVVTNVRALIETPHDAGHDKHGSSTLPRAAPQRASAEKALGQILRFVQLVGREGVAVALTRDELARALAARADATLTALTSDLSCFASYCLLNKLVGLPAVHESVARYVEQLWQVGPTVSVNRLDERARVSKPVKPASIARRLASIGMLHNLLGLENPCRTANVRNAMIVARRNCGTRQRQAAPIRLEAARGQGRGLGTGAGEAPCFTLEVLLEGCDTSLSGLRDAALLSTAYDGGFRASELTNLLVGDVKPFASASGGAGGQVFLSHSKTDQARDGVWVPLSAATMRRLSAWIDQAGLGDESDQPLFRRIQAIVRKGSKGRRAIGHFELAANAGYSAQRLRAIPPRATQVWHQVGQGALSVGGINLILRRAALRAADLGLIDLVGDALDAAVKSLSSHSLRVGLTQDLVSNGADTLGTTIALRWRDPKTALRYARNLPGHENAAAELLARVWQ